MDLERRQTGPLPRAALLVAAFVPAFVYALVAAVVAAHLAAVSVLSPAAR